MTSILVYSDLICPWCYIGKRRMEEALRQMPDGQKTSVSWRPFQLNPGMPSEGMERKAYRTEKFGSWERALARDEQIIETGKTLGLHFRYDLQLNTPNTFDSHRLVWLAGKSGLQDAIVEALFRAYFCEGVNLSRKKNLIEIGLKAGMAAAELEQFYESNQGIAEVTEEEEKGRKLGITGVPFFILNGRLSISGAQSPETFLEAFRQASPR